MGLRIIFELNDNDLEHFRNIMKRAQAAARNVSEGEQIIAAAQAQLNELRGSSVPAFIEQRLDRLETMINMAGDDGWGLEKDDRQHVLGALAYFSESEDLSPDDIPGIGFLDDAIMIELVVRELKHEIEAYEDYCTYRQAEATRRGENADGLGRVDWLEDKRLQLHSRMRRRRGATNTGRTRRTSRSSSSGRGSSFSLW